MRACPFCGFNKGWIKNFEDGFRVECKECGSVGPKSQTDDGAEEKWNGFLQTKDPMDKEEWRRSLVDENMGGVSAPMATLTNTPGVGNAVPASIGAMTGSQQSSSLAIGSGDNWGKSIGPYTQAGKPKKKKAKKKKRVYKKIKKISEQNISPFDKIGIMMAKKMNVPLYFEKGKDQSVKHVKQKQVDKHEIYPYSDYVNLVKGKKKKNKSLNESFRLGGITYDVHKFSFGAVYAGSKGILGNRDILIPWKFIENLMKKYSPR